MSGGREFQRCGAERLKALAPIVARFAGKTSSLMEAADLRDGLEVLMRMRSDRYGGARL